jgi:hypothetical protein
MSNIVPASGPPSPFTVTGRAVIRQSRELQAEAQLAVLKMRGVEAVAELGFGLLADLDAKRKAEAGSDPVLNALCAELEQIAARKMGRIVGQQQVKSERQKLLAAHYTGAIPQDLLASEMKRFTRELADAEAEIQAAKATNSDVEATLALALNAAAHCEVAYLSAPDAVRRQINQGFFERLLIGGDGSAEQAEFTEPFRLLLDHGTALAYQTGAEASQMNPEATNLAGLNTTPADRSRPSSVFLATYGTNGDDLDMT